MRTLSDLFDTALGLSADEANLAQIAARCALFYAAALALVRAADKRFLGKHTAFDVILAVMLGSVVSRAMTDGTSALGKVAAGAFLVALHLAMSNAAFHSDRFGTLVKGHPRVLIQDGRVDWDAMAKSSISRDDLLGLLRIEAGGVDPEDVEVARLERSGDLSVVTKASEPTVVDIDVADGVQVVSIRLR